MVDEKKPNLVLMDIMLKGDMTGITAAETTGPAKQPRPTSSTPAIILLFSNFYF